MSVATSGHPLGVGSPGDEAGVGAVNETDQVAAQARLRRAVDADSQLDDDGLVGIIFNPRNGDYDPTDDLNLLGVAHEVLVVPGKGGDRFEARFRPLTAS